MSTDVADAPSAQGIPDHVPAELVRDFDIFNFIEPTDDLYEAWHRIVNEDPPVFFTPHYGGFWVINRADLQDEAWPDFELFCSTEGIGIPPSPDNIPAFLPIEADPPYQKDLRRPLNMALSPKGVTALADRARALCRKLVEDVAPKGRCEFVGEFSLIMPMELFLHLVNLPSEDREPLLAIVAVALKEGDMEKRFAAQAEMNAYLDKWVRERVENPGDDLMSAVVNMEIDGRPLTHQERVGYMTTAMLGGLDTVGGLMAMSAWHLATHPEHRRTLIDHPEMIPDAVEEILRRHSIATIGRTATRDVTFGGAPIRKGDRIMLATMVHGMDDRRWGNALEVKLDRKPRDHRAFGVGTHRCPGANLARAELKIFIEEWLRVIPEFSIDPDREVLVTTGSVAGLTSLPLVWPTN